MRPLLLALFCTVLALGAACRASRAEAPPDRTAAPAERPQPAQAGPAAAIVVPGSHEDWCDEHAVPESLCTRCNPALIAAFQATGDWCAEHARPESQCTICHPDLVITRPPAAGAH